MEKSNHDFYKKLRARTRQWLSANDGSTNMWAEYLMFAPDLFHLLCKLAIDSGVPVKERAKLAGVVAYFLSPFDLMPEALMGFIGFADDIVLAAYVLNSLINNCNPDIVKKHWAGDQNILDVIRKILNLGDKAGRAGVFGKGVLKKVRKIF